MTSVGVRFDDEMLERLEKLSKEENTDRSTIIRNLVEEGYRRHMADKAAEKYRKGEITLSKAAEKAGLTVWEMQKHLVENGFTSEYSIKNLEQEAQNL